MQTIPKKRRSIIFKLGHRWRDHFDNMIKGSSLIPNDPVLDRDVFAWTAPLRANWQAIRNEAMQVMGATAPSLYDVSPDHRKIAPPNDWRAFFLIGYGERIEPNMARCPATMAAISAIPNLNSAFFSILAPGTHIPAHRGVTKGLITCHLGLIVPDGPVRMRVHDQYVGWSEGDTLVFDDTYDHEVWNDTDQTRVVLLIQVERPLRAPGKWVANFFLGGIRRSPFVREARANIDRWEAGLKAIEAEANEAR